MQSKKTSAYNTLTFGTTFSILKIETKQQAQHPNRKIISYEKNKQPAHKPIV